MLEPARRFPIATAPAPTARLRRQLSYASVGAIFLANAALIVAIWIHHGHLDAGSSPAATLMWLGQLSALMGTYLVLVGMLFVARTPFLEGLLGDRAARYHRVIAISALLLIGLHVISSTAGFALTDGVSVTDEFTTMVVTYPYMLVGLVGFGMFLVIGASSIRFIRARLSYETWTGLHLYAYLAVLLAFGHQLAVGSDFSFHPLARFYWVALYIAVFGLIAVFRVAAPIVLLMRHRFVVDRVVVETSDVVSIYVGGRGLDRLNARAGQYFRLRLLARNEWWRSHPFSVSAMPDGVTLRFTVKALGDFSGRLQSLRPGTRVMLEGPYGALTGARRTLNRVALIGGGIGVTPIRALFEELAGAVDVQVIYRASGAKDLVFWDELHQLERLPGTYVTYLIGRRGTPRMPRDPLSATALRGLVPDIHARDVFVCGPAPMMDAVERSLRELGVPKHQVHTERFAA